MNTFEDGYNAFMVDEPFKEDESNQWKQGFSRAQYDSENVFDDLYYEDELDHNI